MNEKVNKFLLTRNKIIPGKHLGQLGFTYSAYIYHILKTKTECK